MTNRGEAEGKFQKYRGISSEPRVSSIPKSLVGLQEFCIQLLSDACNGFLPSSNYIGNTILKAIRPQCTITPLLLQK